MILRGKPNDRAACPTIALKGPESASIFRRGSGDDVETGTTAHDLSRVISPEGQQLLQHHNLLRPLIEKMVIDETTAAAVVADDKLAEAKLGLLKRRGYSSLEQWPDLLNELGKSDEDLSGQLLRTLRVSAMAREKFAPKAEARFLERKNELDQVVYSLLRLSNRFLARELYLQIESGEANFADLAGRHAEGPERNTNGIVGPVPLTQAHPILVEKLRVAKPGDLLEPFKVSDWWLVVRLERYSPSTFTDEVSDAMCKEMFDAWINELTASSLKRLQGDGSDAREQTS